jgi:hypothetical protein
MVQPPSRLPETAAEMDTGFSSGTLQDSDILPPFPF